MKSLLLLVLVSVTYAQNILVQKDISNIGLKSLTLQATEGERKTVKLLKEKKASFAVVRSDILYLINNQLGRFNFKEYAVLGKLTLKEELVFVGKKDFELRSIESLKKTKISFPNFYNLSGYYLDEIVNELYKSLQLSIGREYFGFSQSIEKIKQGDIKQDGINLLFDFLSKKDKEYSLSQQLKLHMLPKKFREIVLKNKGFREVDERLEVDFYLISLKDVDESVLVPVIKELNEKKLLVSNLDTSLGEINPLIPKVLKDIEDSIDIENELKLVSKKIKNEEKQISKIDTKVLKEIQNVKRNLSNFEDRITKEEYKNAITNLEDEYELLKVELKIKKLKVVSLIKEKNIDELKIIYSELEGMFTQFSTYVNRVKKMNGKIRIDLMKEERKKREEEKALLEEVNKASLGKSLE